MLARLAHVIVRRRRWVIGFWIVLTLFGGFAAGQVSKRWLTQFSIPGYPAYESNQQTLKIFGTGEQAPLIAVFHSSGDITKERGITRAIAAAQTTNRGSRAASYFSTGSLSYVSADRHTTYATIYPAGIPDFTQDPHIKETRAALQAATPAGVTSNLTGRDPLQLASSGSGGPSIITEALIGGLGALGVAIDYALLMIFRFRDELREGEDVETAIVEMMTHAGRSVIVSGSTVAVGLLSMVILPLPFIRSIGIGGMLIPAVSVLAAITLLPALLAVLGTRINSLRVMPRRLVDRGHPEDGAWGRWARFVLRRPRLIAFAGIVIVAALAGLGTQLNPHEPQLRNIPGSGTAIAGRQMLADAGISPGVMKPLDVLVERGG